MASASGTASGRSACSTNAPAGRRDAPGSRGSRDQALQQGHGAREVHRPRQAVRAPLGPVGAPARSRRAGNPRETHPARADRVARGCHGAAPAARRPRDEHDGPPVPTRQRDRADTSLRCWCRPASRRLRDRADAPRSVARSRRAPPQAAHLGHCGLRARSRPPALRDRPDGGRRPASTCPHQGRPESRRRRRGRRLRRREPRRRRVGRAAPRQGSRVASGRRERGAPPRGRWKRGRRACRGRNRCVPTIARLGTAPRRPHRSSTARRGSRQGECRPLPATRRW